MTRLILNIRLKDVIIIFSVVSFAVIVWFAGPWLPIAHQYPLQQPEKRFYLITLIFAAWLLYFITKPASKQTHSIITPDMQKKIELLQKRLQGAIQFLKKTTLNKSGKNIRLFDLPWYLLIGPHHAGKTSLLANANINYILTKKLQHDKIQPSQTTDLWVTRDLVMVDVPGNYLSEKEQLLWDHFLNLIKSKRGSLSLDSVVIALPLPDLMKKTDPKQKNYFIETIKQKISQLQILFGEQLHFYFVITKCDQMPGFLEFFSEGGIEESSQAWGITLPTPKENEKLIDLFTSRFNALIKRLNTQLIWRLHQERNPLARAAIKDFPLQIERLREMLGYFIKSVATPTLHLQGVYLTSALQEHMEAPATQTQLINPTTHQALQLYRPAPPPSKAYFIRQFLLQGLLCKNEHAMMAPLNQHHHWISRTVYAASILSIVTAAFVFGRDFQRNVFETYAIQNNLTQYQLAIQQPGQPGERLLKALPLLNALQTTASRADTNISKLRNFIAYYSNKTQKTADLVYRQSLQTIVLPEIKNAFENYLDHSADKNPVQFYAILNAYLMLGNQVALQEDYFTHVLKDLFPTAISQQINKELINHIHIALSETIQPIELDNKTITHARNQLRSLSHQDLAFVILKNIENNNSENVLTFGTPSNNNDIFINKHTPNRIPHIYTAGVFQKAFTQEIPLATTEALQGNDVIGKSDILANEATITALTRQLHTRYITTYVEIWENVLSNLQLATPSDLIQADTIVNQLTSNTSPLLQILQTVRQQTSFAPIVAASPKLQALNTLLANAHNNRENTLYQSFVALNDFKNYLKTINNFSDKDKGAFEAAKKRMQFSDTDPITQLHNVADRNPEPLRNWLNNLATQSWNLILQGTGRHIETAWQLKVMTIYHSHIANHQEIDKTQFVNFAGKQGSLANFYQTYLKPFVNDTGKQWQWLVVDKERVPLSNQLLDDLQHHAKWQTMSKYALFTQNHESEWQEMRLPERLIEKV